ncbi:hypothetical protein IWW38_004981, partial [Coemansia aciculifera]
TLGRLLTGSGSPTAVLVACRDKHITEIGEQVAHLLYKLPIVILQIDYVLQQLNGTCGHSRRLAKGNIVAIAVIGSRDEGRKLRMIG